MKVESQEARESSTSWLKFDLIDLPSHACKFTVKQIVGKHYVQVRSLSFLLLSNPKSVETYHDWYWLSQESNKRGCTLFSTSTQWMRKETLEFSFSNLVSNEVGFELWCVVVFIFWPCFENIVQLFFPLLHYLGWVHSY